MRAIFTPDRSLNDITVLIDRLITRRAYGFHSATAALALVMLCRGPITLTSPYETR